MNDLFDSWELFSKTGDIDAYLKYKSLQDSTRSGENGEYKDKGFDNQGFRLR